MLKFENQMSNQMKHKKYMHENGLENYMLALIVLVDRWNILFSISPIFSKSPK